jgi:hypothetical protein
VQEIVSADQFFSLSEEKFNALAAPSVKGKVRRFVARKYNLVATKRNGKFGMNGQRQTVIHSISFAKAQVMAIDLRKNGYRVDLIEVQTKVNEKVVGNGATFEIQRELKFEKIAQIPYIGNPSANPEYNQDYMENKWSARKNHQKALELSRKFETRRNPNCSDETIRIYRGIKLLFSCATENELMEWVLNNTRKVTYPNVVVYFPDKVIFNREVVGN